MLGTVRTGYVLGIFSVLLMAGQARHCVLAAQETPSAPAKGVPDKNTAAEAPFPVVLYTKENAPPAPKLEDLPLQQSVSRYGITWTFEKPARVGRFVGGDWYVVGPVTVTMIDPKPLWGDEVKEQLNKSSVKDASYPGKQARNGSELNPPARLGWLKGGFDSRIPSGRYDPNLFTQLPIQMKPGDALISTVSRRNEEITSFSGQHVDPLRTAAALSCLEKPLPPDAFRPSFCDSANSPVFLARNLKRDLLLHLPRLKGMPETLDKYARTFQRPWLDTVENGFAAPVENLPHYGQQMAERVGEGSLLLLMDYKPEEKELLLQNMVQVGIDLWGMARAGRQWQCHGGLNSGRKWPILQAGILLGDENMQTPKKLCPKARFHEDDQTAMCPYTYKGPPCPEGKTFACGWTGAKAVFLGHSLAADGSGDWATGFGPVDLFPPKEWMPAGQQPSSDGYRRNNTSGCWVGEALAARLFHAEKIWDHEGFFAYVDRWMTEEDTQEVQAAVECGWGKYLLKAKFGDFTRQGYVSGANWVKEMWVKYRNNLPPASDGHKDPTAEATWK